MRGMFAVSRAGVAFASDGSQSWPTIDASQSRRRVERTLGKFTRVRGLSYIPIV